MKHSSKFRSVAVLAAAVLLAGVLAGCNAPAAGTAGGNAAGEPATTWDSSRPYASHESTVAWLKIPGTKIDNAVLQADDNETWLRTNEDGKNDIWGCYFADYECSVPKDGALSHVTIVYGHSKGDEISDQRFCALKNFREEEFCKNTPVLEFSTPGCAMQWKIVAACEVPASYNYLDPEPDAERFAHLSESLLGASDCDFGETIKPDDKLLLLSTCTSDEELRYVVAAKLVKTPAEKKA